MESSLIIPDEKCIKKLFCLYSVSPSLMFFLKSLKAVKDVLREVVDNLCKYYSSPSQLICSCICSLFFLRLTGRQKRNTWPRHKDKDTKEVISAAGKRVQTWTVGYLVGGSWGTDLGPLLWQDQTPGWQKARPGRLPLLWPWRVPFWIKQRHRTRVKTAWRIRYGRRVHQFNTVPGTISLHHSQQAHRAYIH